MHTLFKILTAPIVLSLSLAGYAVVPEDTVQIMQEQIADLQVRLQEPTKVGGDNFTPVSGQTYYLFGSGVSNSDTSVKLTKFTLPVSDQKIAMSDFGGVKGCATIEPGVPAKQEVVSFTGVTQNSDGTALLTGLTRGLSPIPPYTASSTLQISHSGATKLILSNPSACFYESFNIKANDETITGLWTFGDAPIITTTGTSSSQIATRGEVANSANQGAATSTTANGGIVELGTAEEAAKGFNGGLSKPTVLTTSISSSTPTVGVAQVMVSSTTGYMDGNLFLATSSTNANPNIIRFGQNIFINGSTTPNTATTTFNVPVDIDASTDNPIRLNGVTCSFPSSVASGTVFAIGENCTINAYNPATVLTYWATSTYQAGGATGDQVFTHSLGRKPQVIEIHGASGTDGTSVGTFATSFGVATGTGGNQNASAFATQDTTGSEVCGNSVTGSIIYFVDSVSCPTTDAIASITAYSNTSVTLNWVTNNGSKRRLFTMILR